MSSGLGTIENKGTFAAIVVFQNGPFKVPGIIENKDCQNGNFKNGDVIRFECYPFIQVTCEFCGVV